MRAPMTAAPSNRRRPSRQHELRLLDVTIYDAVAASTTPTLDRDMVRLSRVADHSKLWLATATLLAATGAHGRRAAVAGLSSLAIASASVNLVLKPLSGRRRPDRQAHRMAPERRVVMPGSTSFPSGHAASAFAFASGVSRVSPVAAVPLQLMAALVAYSRIHTGVHYPSDVVAGGLIGAAVAANAPLSRLGTSRRGG
jgi:membrane-associated phospholipid phosphatase